MKCQQWEYHAQVAEYMSAVNPSMPKINVIKYSSILHKQRETKIFPFDLSSTLKTNYPATSPNLIAGFLYICEDDNFETNINATSHIFYVIKGKGYTKINSGVIEWKQGDLFILPSIQVVLHTATEDTTIYWVNDSPLLNYLGVQASVEKFTPILYTQEYLTRELNNICKTDKDKNRTGILLYNKNFPLTMTLTHTLWTLYSVVSAGVIKKAHRHNSIALDLCIYAGTNTYTLIGKEIDVSGDIIDPTKVMWTTGSVFITPPGLWHSHHNESNEDAIVLPIQDAGLLMNMQVLDFQYSNYTD